MKGGKEPGFEAIVVIHMRKDGRDFPGGPVVKNLLANAGLVLLVDMGSIPGLENKIPHATWQLSPGPTTIQAYALPRASAPQQEKPPQ